MIFREGGSLIALVLGLLAFSGDAALVKRNASETIPGLARLQLQGVGQFGDPSYSGGGCLPGQMSVRKSLDGSAISFLPDYFIAEAGNQVGRVHDGKGCQINVPVYIPQGQCFKGFNVDHRVGDVLPAGAQRKFCARYGVNAYAGERDCINEYGPANDGALIAGGLGRNDPFPAFCGGNGNIVIDAAIEVDYDGPGVAQASIDSSDLINEPHSAGESTKPGLAGLIFAPFLAAFSAWQASNS